MARVGDTIGRYVLRQELGKGAAGAVFLADDTLLEVPVCIKLLHEALATDQAVLERFKRELLIARRVAHPGVCRMFDLGEEGETRYLVMEYIEGEDLARVLNRERRLPIVRALSLLRQVCQALGAAHREGVIHRDLKPGNILLRSDGRATLVDFGIATATDLGRLTRPGIVMGSRSYMAPEIWQGQPPTPAADVWAAGVILYGCLTGRLPYRGEGFVGVLEAIQTTTPTPPSVHNPEVPKALEAVVAKAMQVEIAERFADGNAMDEALALVEQAWQTGVEPAPAPDPAPVVVPAPAASLDAAHIPGSMAAPPPVAAHVSLASGHGAPAPASSPPTPDATASGQDATAAASMIEAVADPPAEEPPPDRNLDANSVARLLEPPGDPSQGAAAIASQEGDPGFDEVETKLERSLAVPAPSSSPAAAPVLADLAADPASREARDPQAAPSAAPTLTAVAPDSAAREDPVATAATHPAPPMATDPASLPNRQPPADERTVRVRELTIDRVAREQEVARRRRVTRMGAAVLLLVGCGFAGYLLSRSAPVPPPDSRPTDPGVVPTPAGDMGPTVGSPGVSSSSADPPPDAGRIAVAEDHAPGTATADAVPTPAGGNAFDFEDDVLSTLNPEPATRAPRSPPRKPAGLLSDQRRYKAARRSLDGAITRRGLLWGDVPALDRQRRAMSNAARAGRFSLALEAAERAQGLVGTASVDKAFVDQKLARFNRQYDKAQDPGHQKELSKIFGDVARAMSRADYERANAALNQGFSLLGKNARAR